MGGMPINNSVFLFIASSKKFKGLALQITKRIKKKDVAEEIYDFMVV